MFLGGRPRFPKIMRLSRDSACHCSRSVCSDLTSTVPPRHARTIAASISSKAKDELPRLSLKRNIVIIETRILEFLFRKFFSRKKGIAGTRETFASRIFRWRALSLNVGVKRATEQLFCFASYLSTWRRKVSGTSSNYYAFPVFRNGSPFSSEKKLSSLELARRALSFLTYSKGLILTR